MANPQGTPIWYELLTSDAKAASAFYERVVGWTIPAPAPTDPMAYWHIETANGMVGGMMTLSNDMTSQGARPTWLSYIAVDDVDATVKKAIEAGGKLLMPAMNLDKVGRFALIADPQGIPIYVMRGASEETSHAFERTGMGKCNWNELSTPDQAVGNAFYTKVFGWTYPDKMSMGPMGDYMFIDAAGQGIGATMPKQPDGHPGWTFYFRVPNIDEAVTKIAAAGGKVIVNPMEVPGGDRVLVAVDPQGVHFGLVAQGKPA
ncbi:Glyoxalase/Bleomycin resistance protein/dioxygenase domain protein [Labilithrix luteola]|uniref:Glyoxalase/Bleomycin resistance protein/dioxygenase domain protein n=1 Tax=Labilithrix luteola TaxID=1391654 RepID=A0A0K1QGH6_9BACT|nr:VOC family protein [Labilithrix luteola]AKV04823.1 Glyoxalase/Bleomycin resistance protein/dioxygenase domain protein [Labilithrix luteola]